MKFKHLLPAALLILSPFFMEGAPSYNAKKHNMMRDLDVIEHTFETMYAPAQWKKNHLRWDLTEQIHKAKVEIYQKEQVTTKEFQRIVKRILDSMDDYHVSAKFFSTESAILPFKIKSAEGRYFIDWIHEFYSDFLLSSSFFLPEIQKGDELIAVDGKPIRQAMEELVAKELRPAGTKTDYALAEGFFTFRLGILGHEIPKGFTTIEIKHKKSHKIDTYKMYWGYLEEEVENLPAAEQGKGRLYCKQMISPLFDAYMDRHAQITKKMFGSETNTIGNSIPVLGKVLWEAPKKNRFNAYIFQHPNKKRIGFVQIPTYSPACCSKEFEEYSNDFAFIIRKFESSTDKLVIDQLNNRGGSLFYMYALASMLSDQPLQVPKQRMTITQEEIYWAAEEIPDLEAVKNDEEAMKFFDAETMHGYPVDYNLAQSLLYYDKFLIEEWKMGHTFTDLDYICGISHIKPNPHTHYTKPILLLINELDFSCADFMPAVLQDNGRATLMGTQTAGAGGFVLQQGFYNQNGIAYFSFTGSIAERMNGNPIENLGVKPDIPYELTVQDLLNNYQDYIQAIHKAL